MNKKAYKNLIVKRSAIDLSNAQAAIDRKDEICYDIAANEGQIFDNVKHMRWFVEAVAEELSLSPAEGSISCRTITSSLTAGEKQLLDAINQKIPKDQGGYEGKRTHDIEEYQKRGGRGVKVVRMLHKLNSMGLISLVPMGKGWSSGIGEYEDFEVHAKEPQPS
jgi:hypothetical protein